MKVLISKYEMRAIEERWPDFEMCPDYVEVACIFPSVLEMAPEQRERLRSGLTAALCKSKSKRAKR
jgi:hypothetical protein